VTARILYDAPDEIAMGYRGRRGVLGGVDRRHARALSCAWVAARRSGLGANRRDGLSALSEVGCSNVAALTVGTVGEDRSRDVHPRRSAARTAGGRDDGGLFVLRGPASASIYWVNSNGTIGSANLDGAASIEPEHGKACERDRRRRPKSLPEQRQRRYDRTRRS
jgi:hypothetical protein